MDRNKILTRRSVEAMIAEGQAIVVFEDCVLRLDSWLQRHPGGRLAILHMVGRDATDEMKAYHTDATLRAARAYRIGRKPAGPWINMTPPIRGGIYRRSEALPADSDARDDDEGLDTDEEDVVSDSSSQVSERSSTASSFTSDSGSGSGSEACSPAAQKPRPGAQSSIRRRIPDGAAPAAARSLPLPPLPLPLPTAGQLTDLALQQQIDQDIQGYPSLEQAVQQDIVRKYQALHRRVQDEGFYDCPYLEYGKEVVRYAGLFAAFLVALRHGWFLTSAVFLGLFWHQIMFTAHDAGHRAITGIFVVDTLIGLFIADFCCGLSIAWWKSSHNVHHLVTNHPEHDPDIQNVPLFATCPSFFKSLRSTYYDFTFAWDVAAELMVPYQRYTYYPVMAIARFNLYLLSWLHVLSTKSSSLGGSKAWWVRPAEIAFMSCYWFLFGYCLLWRSLPTWAARAAFVLVSHVVTMPLHVQITLSHWGMSTSALGESESFAQRQLRTTMDVDCPAWLDFLHGGLQFQAVHHLFPRVPRHRLRELQVLVREFCDDTGIPYSILGFVDGNRKVLRRLDEVSDQVNILISCQKYMAETGESGLH